MKLSRIAFLITICLLLSTGCQAVSDTESTQSNEQTRRGESSSLREFLVHVTGLWLGQPVDLTFDGADESVTTADETTHSNLTERRRRQTDLVPQAGAGLGSYIGIGAGGGGVLGVLFLLIRSFLNSQPGQLFGPIPKPTPAKEPDPLPDPVGDDQAETS